MAEDFIPRRPVIVVHSRIQDVDDEAAKVAAFLKERGLDAPYGSLHDEDLRRRTRAGEFDLLIAMGGDGTMLRAGHLCAQSNVPILGIMMGHLGFLMQVSRSEWPQMLERLLRGEGWIEQRMMLSAQHIRHGVSLAEWQALNEVVVGRGTEVRAVRLEASVDGLPLTTYVCDGLVASTATGSTAYALAAGGPILPPELRNILLVPIAPHLSVDRAVVLSEGSAVRITVESENSVVSVDGQTALPLDEGDCVDVRSAGYAARFVRFGDPGYFYRNLNAHLNQPHL